MFKLRHAISAAFLILFMHWPHSAVLADQPFQRFLPLLVDLAGWQGKKPEGMSMQMSDASMTTATRDYERGPAQVHASVVVGQAAEGALAPIQTGVNLQTTEGHMITVTIRGMPVLKTFNTKDKSGALMVALSKDAMFSIAYEGVTEDEAVQLAEKFNWNALQTAAQMKK
ncbi:hypothetical protein [Bradyrhizobium sediminis]|nr:hypothetical protein [Bradyrhizobium sediminis]